MREFRTSGSVRGEGGDILAYSAGNFVDRAVAIKMMKAGIRVGLQRAHEVLQVLPMAEPICWITANAEADTDGFAASSHGDFTLSIAARTLNPPVNDSSAFAARDVSKTSARRAASIASGSRNLASKPASTFRSRPKSRKVSACAFNKPSRFRSARGPITAQGSKS